MTRPDISFRSSRLTQALSSKVIRAIDKVEARKSSYSSVQYVIQVPEKRRSKDSSHSSTLQEEFDRAELAELPTEPYLLEESKYPSIRALTTDADIGDGLWLCCFCGHENILRHYKGPFPFKYLCCNRCTRKLCSGCHTSEILSPLPHGLINAPRPTSGCEVRYCQVCCTCGLSHRADMENTTLDFYNVVCAGCGTSSYGDWPRYYIGNVEPYRRDPNISFATLIDKRATKAVASAFSVVIANTETRISSIASCENLLVDILEEKDI